MTDTLLIEPQKKYLRGLAHQKKAIVMVGNQGLTDNVMTEIGKALDFHELIKIKVRVGDRKDRDEVLSKIVAQQGCQLIQRVGNTATLFKRNRKNAKIQIPLS